MCICRVWESGRRQSRVKSACRPLIDQDRSGSAVRSPIVLLAQPGHEFVDQLAHRGPAAQAQIARTSSLAQPQTGSSALKSGL